MILNEILARLSGVRRGWKGYAAKCPAHDDNLPSLTLTESNGRILIKCFAGCETRSIIDAIGLRWTDLFDNRITEPSRISLGEYEKKLKTDPSDSVGITRSSSDQRIHDVYRYVNEQGYLLYENVRFHPKGFRQRHRDAKGKLHWNLNDVRRVPYRLPELIAAREKGGDIFLCEGEKDADALAELGFTASNFKGWNEEWNQYIQGCYVVIVQDHDLPGKTLADEAARVILRSAAAVKILDVFADRELAEKNGLDISDYIKFCVNEQGEDADTIKERLSLVLNNTPNWKDTTSLQTDHYFVVQSGNEWIQRSKTQPIPLMLFGEFWFENELCILFADTNVGKSILAVQIADAISKGISVNDRLVTEALAQKVVYFDFELTSKQFESRFSERINGSGEYVNHYLFHRNFYRAEINPDTSDIGAFAKFEDFLNHALETTIVSSGAKILIIDNLTYLRDETENARNALPLMKYLKKLKSKHGLSILALAHTPKRDATKPLNRNDLQGSKMLINFCDSSFAIGESSKSIGVRYLKQIKARNSEIIYHAENVLLATIAKAGNFLNFTFGETAMEQEHLRVINDKQRQDLVAQAKELKAKGMTQQQIATEIGISQISVSRYLKL
jgi:hypothetical protein